MAPCRVQDLHGGACFTVFLDRLTVILGPAQEGLDLQG